jgi:choline dehydrogenase-like flavoprotein
MNNKFKHIVIGSGAGGSVVSLELSKKRGKRCASRGRQKI